MGAPHLHLLAFLPTVFQMALKSGRSGKPYYTAKHEMQVLAARI